MNTPKHSAFIMDGNGRWATGRQKPRIAGHYEGAKRLKEIVQAAAELQLECVSFFAFGIENWKRPESEVTYIWNLVKRMFTKKAINWLQKNNIQFKWIGFDNVAISREVVSILKDVEALTTKNTGTIFNLFMNYSGQADILQAVTNCQAIKEPIDSDTFNGQLLTRKLPPVDLLIRTSGEARLSNFMLWQISYSEIIFTPTLWPDFTRDELLKCLAMFASRQRRFGGLHQNADR